MGTYASDPQTLGIGLLLVRAVIGSVMAAHGAQKLFGWLLALTAGIVGGFANLTLRRVPGAQSKMAEATSANRH